MKNIPFGSYKITALFVLAVILINGAFFVMQKYSLAEFKLNITKSKRTIGPPIFNIVDFGGSESNADNSKALQAAINAATTIKHELREDNKWDIYTGKVFIPAGEWQFKKGVFSDWGVEILGDGLGKTLLEYSGDSIFLDFSSEREKFDLQLKHLFIKQTDNKATAVSLKNVNRNSSINNIVIDGGGIGIEIVDCYTPTFREFFIYDQSKYGIYAENATNTDFSSFKIEGCNIGALFTQSSVNSSTGLRLFGGVLQGCNKEGLILRDLTNFTSYSTFLEGNGRSPNFPQITISSNLDGVYDNNLIAFYGTFITGGHTTAINNTAVVVENTETFVFNEGFIRSNAKIDTGIFLGKNVENAQLLNTSFEGVTNDYVQNDPISNVIYDPLKRKGRGYGRQFVGLGAASTKVDNRHYLESYQAIFGTLNKGKVGIGTYNGTPSLQGFGHGSSFNFQTNPKAGNHISAPNGITQVAGIQLGTTITSSNFTTNIKTRNVIVNTNNGLRYVSISKTEESAGRELLIKNSGSLNKNDLVIKSEHSAIDNRKTLVLHQNEAVTLIFDGNQWQIMAKSSELSD